MAGTSVTCVYDSRTFVGRYEVAGEGACEHVSVTFQGQSMAVTVDGLRPEIVAHALLHELVRERLLLQAGPAARASRSERRATAPGPANGAEGEPGVA